MTRKLLSPSVFNLPPPSKDREELRDTRTPLVLRITKGGHRTFIVRARVKGEKQPIRIAYEGPAEPGSLEAARAWAVATMTTCARGADPRALRTAAAAATVVREQNRFSSVASSFLKKHASKNRSFAESARILARYALPLWKDRPMSGIKRADVVALLDDIEAGTFKGSDGKLYGGPVMADRVLAQLRKLMNWHAARDSDYVSPIVKGMARTKPRERARERILDDDELRALWAALGKRDAGAARKSGKSAALDVFASLVRVLLLTAQRREEVAQMGRAELTPDGLWTIPAERNKTKRPELVPLPAQALATIHMQRIVNRGGLVFTNNGEAPFSGFSKAKARLDSDMLAELRKIATARKDAAMLARLDEIARLLKAAHKGDKEAREKLKTAWWTLHDLRRTGKTLMARAGVRPNISERVLGHVIAGVEGVYDRHNYVEEKREALSALASMVKRIVASAPDNVVRLVRTAAQ